MNKRNSIAANIGLLLAVSSGMLPVIAFARLGEKLPELIKQYGQPVLETTTSYEFKSGNLAIVVMLGQPGQMQGEKSMAGCSVEEHIKIPGVTFTDDALNEILTANGIDDGKIVKRATRESWIRKSKDGTRLAEFNIDAISVKLVGVTSKQQNATGY